MFPANTNPLAFPDSSGLLIIMLLVPAALLFGLTVGPMFVTVMRFSRLQSGNTEKILERAERGYERGNRSLFNLLMLSAGHSYLGRGVPGERYAREAHDEAERIGIAQKRGMRSHLLTDLVRIALFDAKVAQGRFVEAAKELEPFINQNMQPVFTAVLVAWGYFLGEDYDQARMLINPASFVGMQSKITARYRFMLAYMVQQLYGMDMRAHMRRDQVKAWEKEIDLNATNPYGVRAREILRDAVRLLG